MKYQDKFEPETFFHIYNHAVGTENLFRNPDNYRFFLKKYSQYTAPIWETYAYCLLPNHFHFLVRIKPLEELQNLPKFNNSVHQFTMQKFSNFLNSYAKSYNKIYERRGALFLDFTKRIAVRDEAYFTTLVNYIHQNPVHHGFCKQLDDWQFSSYQACLSSRPTKLQREQLIAWFGNAELFEKFHQENNALLVEELEFL